MRYDCYLCVVTTLMMIMVIRLTFCRNKEDRLLCGDNESRLVESFGCMCITTRNILRLHPYVPLPLPPYANKYIDCSFRKSSTLSLVRMFEQLDQSFTDTFILDLSRNSILELSKMHRLPQLVDTLTIRNPYNHRDKLEDFCDNDVTCKIIIQSNNSSNRSKLTLCTKNTTSLRCFEIKIHRYEFLRHIDLSYNCIERIPQIALWNATKLVSLKLAYNAIRFLPAYSIGFHHNLVLVDISGNQLSKLHINCFSRHPHAYAGALLLDYLDMSYNRLERIPNGVFNYLTNLRTLLLQGNKLISIQCTFKYNPWRGLLKLKYLDLDYNQLRSISFDEYGCGLHSLVNLSLSGNKLWEFHACHFSKLMSLQSLQLSDNLIKSFNNCVFYNMSSIRSISLNTNRYLTELNETCALFNLPSRSVSLSGNSLNCDCSFYIYTHFPPYSISFNGQECESYLTIQSSSSKLPLCFQNYNSLYSKCSQSLLSCKTECEEVVESQRIQNARNNTNDTKISLQSSFAAKNIPVICNELLLLIVYSVIIPAVVLHA
ncbi:hypothetical protein GJ496_001876 [Pomphorhynchus laevis]|nr:hypothetical protein GJ496_001876 [Pomphorhynchus laevis]